MTNLEHFVSSRLSRSISRKIQVHWGSILYIYIYILKSSLKRIIIDINLQTLTLVRSWSKYSFKTTFSYFDSGEGLGGPFTFLKVIVNKEVFVPCLAKRRLYSSCLNKKEPFVLLQNFAAETLQSICFFKKEKLF